MGKTKKAKKAKRIIIYHRYIPRLGGVETAIYSLAKGLDREGYDVTIAYERVESYESLFGYSRVANIVNVSELEVEGDVCLQASNHPFNKNIKAKRYLQWIHSDYSKYNQRLNNIGDIEKYIAVSKYAKEVIEEQENIKGVEVIHNIIDEDFGKKKYLKLVTASRISHEKGFGRMLGLAKLLKAKGVDFVWTVYGDNSRNLEEERDLKESFSEMENVYFVGYKLDVQPALQSADYLVQLSDWEGCPYSVLEALKMEVPCLVTNWGGVEEVIQDGVNGYILPMETEDYGKYIDKIANKIPKFKYEPLSTIDNWIKIIEKKK